MKIVSPQEMANLEHQAYESGYKEIDFMENAGKGIAEVCENYIENYFIKPTILLLCGKGNNGGDAFVAGRYLIQQGFEVFAIQPEDIKNCSPLCQQNRQQFEKVNGKIYENFSHCPTFELILDGFFGTGFKGSIQEPYLSLINQANKSNIPILSIDIPSGLNGADGSIESTAIKAVKTIYLGFPKIGYFLNKGWEVVGELEYVDFGLPSHFDNQTPTNFELITAEKVHSLLPYIPRSRHKYLAGYVIGLAGSPSMPGAALLSSLAAYRGGCGMVRLFHPKGMESELSASPYELIKQDYVYEKPEEILEAVEKAKAIFVGPGLGRTTQVKELLSSIIPKLTKPTVLDADGLYFLAESNFKLPEACVLTPHTGEMQRLLHLERKLEISEADLELCQKYADEKKVTLVLKGAPTFIFYPGLPVLINPTGDPGMATAGSGDVLTGLIASLLAQGLDGRDAAALGVFLHGLAGQYAAMEHTSRSMLASDLIANFNHAYNHIDRY